MKLRKPQAVSAPLVKDMANFIAVITSLRRTTDNENDWPGSASVSLALGATKMVALPGLFTGEKVHG